MTLADCIAKYQTVQAQPINRRTSALTPIGNATVAARRLADALVPLTAAERRDVIREFIGAEIEFALTAS
jgi:hypothetical protein